MRTRFSSGRLNQTAGQMVRRLVIEPLESRHLMDVSGALISPEQKIVQFRIQLTDKYGHVLEAVHVDDELLLSVYVKDLRLLPSNSLQLYSAYTELKLESDLLEATAVGRLGGDVWDFNRLVARQSSSHDRPIEIGGVITAPSSSDTGHLLYSMPVRAIAEGEGSIDTGPIQSGADLYSTAVYGVSEPLPTESLVFDSHQLVVLPKVNRSAGDPIVSTPHSNQPSTQPLGPSNASPSPTVVWPWQSDEPAYRPESTLSLPGSIASPSSVAQPLARLSDSFLRDDPGSKSILSQISFRTVDACFASKANHKIWEDGESEMLSQSVSLRHEPLTEGLPATSKSLSIFGSRRFETESGLSRDFLDFEFEPRTSTSFIDELLGRSRNESEDAERWKDFQWEASTARTSMRRLPLHRTNRVPQSVSQVLEQMEWADMFVSDSGTSGRPSLPEHGLTMQRIPLQTIPMNAETEFAHDRSPSIPIPVLHTNGEEGSDADDSQSPPSRLLISVIAMLASVLAVVRIRKRR